MRLASRPLCPFNCILRSSVSYICSLTSDGARVFVIDTLIASELFMDSALPPRCAREVISQDERSCHVRFAASFGTVLVQPLNVRTGLERDKGLTSKINASMYTLRKFYTRFQNATNCANFLVVYWWILFSSLYVTCDLLYILNVLTFLLWYLGGGGFCIMLI